MQQAGRALCVALLWMVALWAAPQAQAQIKSEAEIQTAIEALLEQRHPTDTADWWRGLGPQAPAVVERMARSATQTYHRIRLLQALGWYDSASGRQYLKAIATETPDDVLRNTAIRSVGMSGGAREEEWVAQFLTHADPQTRYATAETLQRIGTPSAKARVERYLAQEPAPWIAGKLKGELPRALAPIAKSGSSDDQPSPDWVGSWQGVWVDPAQGARAARDAKLSIDMDGPQAWKGRLNLAALPASGAAPAAAARVPELVEWRGQSLKGSVAQGEYQDASGKLHSWNAQLSLEGRRLVIRAAVPSLSATLVLWRFR